MRRFAKTIKNGSPNKLTENITLLSAEFTKLLPERLFHENDKMIHKMPTHCHAKCLLLFNGDRVLKNKSFSSHKRTVPSA